MISCYPSLRLYLSLLLIVLPAVQPSRRAAETLELSRYHVRTGLASGCHGQTSSHGQQRAGLRIGSSADCSPVLIGTWDWGNETYKRAMVLDRNVRSCCNVRLNSQENVDLADGCECCQFGGDMQCVMADRFCQPFSY